MKHTFITYVSILDNSILDNAILRRLTQAITSSCVMASFIVAVFITAATPVSATSLLPINLQQLSTRASLIFYGEVMDNQTKKDVQSGHIATFTEFKIIETIKGNPGETHTMKQLGGYDENSAIKVRVHGVPTFKTGKKYIVFLPEKSSLGFCSPLGLRQGVFSVFAREGETIVSNGHNLSPESSAGNVTKSTSQETESNNLNHLSLAVRADNPTQSRLEDFINTVRAYNTPTYNAP